MVRESESEYLAQFTWSTALRAPRAGELSRAEMDTAKKARHVNSNCNHVACGLPLNSRNLTAAQLQQISCALNLPTQGSCDQLRQCIKGRLDTEGHEACNMLVVMRDAPDGGTTLELADCEETFLEFDQSIMSPDHVSETAGTLVMLRRDVEEAQQELQQELEQA